MQLAEEREGYKNSHYILSRVGRERQLSHYRDNYLFGRNREKKIPQIFHVLFFEEPHLFAPLCGKADLKANV